MPEVPEKYLSYLRDLGEGSEILATEEDPPWTTFLGGTPGGKPLPVQSPRYKLLKRPISPFPPKSPSKPISPKLPWIVRKHLEAPRPTCAELVDLSARNADDTLRVVVVGD